MSQKGKIRRWRRTIAVESLEERTVLSGNVTVSLSSELPGHLIILDDLAGNNFSINAFSSDAGPMLEVSGFAGSPPGPEDTTINGGMNASFPLSSISAIDINNPAFSGTPDMVSGNNHIQIGNETGFTIPGNMVVDLGSGHDLVTMNKINDNITQFNGTFGGGTGSDTVTINNCTQGAAMIMPGSGTNRIDMTNDTEGLVEVSTPPSTHNQSVQILNCNNAPIPRSAAIGLLQVSMGITGNSTGNNTITLAGDSIGLARIQSGNRNGGTQDSNTVAIANDTITGASLTVQLENGSGMNNGTADAAVNQITSYNVLFTNGGNYITTADDGPSYLNGDHTLKTTSLYSQTLTNGAGADKITLGRNFQDITAGNSDTPGANDIDTGTFAVTAWQGANRVKVSVESTGDATIAIDQATSSAIGYFFDNGLPAPQMTVTGSIGIGAMHDLAIFIGDSWPLTVSPVTVAGNLFIDPPSSSVFAVAEPASPISLTNEPGNGNKIAVTSATIGGLLQIFEGSGNESVIVGAADNPVVASDLDIETFSNAGDNVGLTVTNATVTDPSALRTAYIQDHGAGNDTFVLGGNGAAGDPLGLGGGAVNVASAMEVFLAGSPFSRNIAKAENVSALTATIDGGSQFGSSSDFTGVDPIYGNFILIVNNFTTVR